MHEGSIFKIVWVPPEFGDAVACVCEDGTFSLWEELAEGKSWICCSLLLTSTLGGIAYALVCNR